jgi:uncharacterized protein YjbI with pentapeptide repeats
MHNPLHDWFRRAIALAGMVVLIVGFGLGNAAPAGAQLKEYAPPLSFSNAELGDRDFSGQTLIQAEFSNANLVHTNFDHAQLQGAVFSAALLIETNFRGADLTNALMDSTQFQRTDLRDAIFHEAMLIHSTFEDVDITGADFEGALLDRLQVKRLCAIASGTNPTTGNRTRDTLGCR